VAFLILARAASAADADEQDWDADENTLQLKSIPSSLRSHRFNCVVETPRGLRIDNQRVLWIGTRDGLWRWRQGSNEAEKIPLSGRNGVPLAEVFSVNSLLCLDKNLWIGSAHGLYVLDLTARDPKPSQETGWPVEAVNCFTSAGRTLWVGTIKALYRLDEARHSSTANRKLWKPVSSLAWDGSHKRLWVATPYGLFHSEQACEEAAGPTRLILQALATPGTAQAGAPLAAWAQVLTGFGLMGSNTLPTVFPYDAKNHFQHSSIAYSDRFAALHPYEKTLWTQMRNGPQNVVRLKNVMSDQGRSVECEESVDFVSGLVERKNILWIGAQKAPQARAEPVPNVRVGLFRWRRELERDDPMLKGPLVEDELVGLSQVDDTLWMATNNSLYRLNGLKGEPWHPTIVITNITRPGLVNPIFTGNTVRITWKKAKNLAGRTTPQWIDFKLFVKEDGEDRYHEEGSVLSGKSKGEWEASYTTKRAGNYKYEIHAYDLAGNETVVANDALDSDALQGVMPSFTVQSPLWWLLKWLGSLLFVVILLMLYLAPLRRAFLVHCFGYRYNLIATDYPPFVFVAERQNVGVFKMAYDPTKTKEDQDPNPVDFRSGLPVATRWIREKRTKMRGKTALVRVDEDDFGYPLAWVLGGDWSDGRETLVAGQLIRGAPEVKPEPRKGVCFAALGCRQNKDGQLRDLPKVPTEVAAVVKLFGRTGAKVLTGKLATEREEAKVEDFRRAMRGANVVHVAAHACAEEIQFFDGPFRVDDISGLGEIPCKLLVLSACKAADFRGAKVSLARAFVAKNVNVLASLMPVWDDFCEVFFPSFYARLLPPRWHFSGVDVGTAIRMAAGEWVGQMAAPKRRKRRTGFVTRLSDLLNYRESMRPRIDRDVAAGSQDRDSIDSFVLFGNPCLQIHLRRDL
jgi:hypothetical protein